MAECCICYKNDGYVCLTSCKHNICCRCIMKLKKKVCPLCRKDLSKDLDLSEEKDEKKDLTIYDDDYWINFQLWNDVDLGIGNLDLWRETS